MTLPPLKAILDPMIFLIRLFLIYLLFLLVRFLWRVGRTYYLLQKQMKDLNQQDGRFRQASPWSFIFTTRRWPGRSARSAHSYTEEDAAATQADFAQQASPPPHNGGEVIDAQFRVLSEKDDN